MLNILAFPSRVTPKTIYGLSKEASSEQIKELFVIVRPSYKDIP